jgi:Rieske Fe-S protein
MEEMISKGVSMEVEPVLEPKMFTRAEDLRRCEVCGNEYDKCMEIKVGGMTHVFDSFECAVHALAPRCAHCGCQILGHGMESHGAFFCCAHCASQVGVPEMNDRVETERSRL